jgi:phosphoribosylformylglycinamidine synthase I
MIASVPSGPRVCVLKADGTNCEIETAHAFKLAGGKAHVVPMNLLRSGAERLADYDVLALPGGFSYGDDVVSGKVMAVELVSFLADALADFALARKPILGICNGFQVLVRTGLLPFGQLGAMRATLALNASGRFECRWVRLRASGSGPLVQGLPEQLELPLAHGEGRFFADEATLADIEAQGLVALRYVDAMGRPTEQYPENPNGAVHAIAGLADPSGRILGLMPHPERYISRFQHPAWRLRAAEQEPDGLAFFRQVLSLA